MTHVALVAGLAIVVQAPVDGLSHDLWDGVLHDHVGPKGRVDYAAIKSDARFRQYVERLASAKPDAMPDDNARLAFWINAYNALMIQVVLDHLPADPKDWPAFKPTSIKISGKNAWKGVAFRVAGRSLTLDGIENDIIRATKGLRDPRIHTALVCAATSCPPLCNQAYTGDTLQEQLDRQMRKQINDPSRTVFDRTRRVVRLAMVFDWYKDDFVDKRFSPRADTLLGFIAAHVDDDALAESLRTARWSVEFIPYDWRLNIQAKP